MQHGGIMALRIEKMLSDSGRIISLSNAENHAKGRPRSFDAMHVGLHVGGSRRVVQWRSQDDQKLREHKQEALDSQICYQAMSIV